MDRDQLRFLTSLMLSILINLIGLTFVILWQWDGMTGLADMIPQRVLHPLEDPNDPVVGENRARTMALAFMAHDAPQLLQAPHAPFDQPTVQRDVEPQPDAPQPVDPSQSSAAQPAQPSSPALQEQPQAQPTPQQAASPSQADASVKAKPAMTDDAKPRDVEGLVTAVEDVEPETAEASASETPTNAEDNPPAVETSDPPQPAQTALGETEPTIAQRDEKEAEARSPSDVMDVVPGKTVAREGLEIRTVRPKFSTVTRLTAMPRNPAVVIRFNQAGIVRSAEIVRSSGYQMVDSALLACIYQWTATGDILNHLNQDQTHDILVRIFLRQ